MNDLSFWYGKRVFLTGHTGFKGAWLCRMLTHAGADLTGYSLEPPTNPNLFSLSGAEAGMTSVIGDIRDRERLMPAFLHARPEIVIHMAAQPIVQAGYQDPVYTYETNVMGTVNILECARQCDGVKSFLNVTTDKVYLNYEWERGYQEDDPLDGRDPYSNSKSCSEIVTHSYKASFFSDGQTAVSTARSGNVIGGGDFAPSRILPDCIHKALKGVSIPVRNPQSVRPYQHVLEALFAYLMIAQKQYADGGYAGYYNVGPDDQDCVSTGQLVDLFCKSWGNGITWEYKHAVESYETNYLKLDCSKLKAVFGWKPRWDVATAVEKTVEWTRIYLQNGDIRGMMDKQITEYQQLFHFIS